MCGPFNCRALLGLSPFVRCNIAPGLFIAWRIGWPSMAGLPVQYPERGRTGDCWPISATSRVHSPATLHTCAMAATAPGTVALDWLVTLVDHGGVSRRGRSNQVFRRWRLPSGSYFLGDPMPPIRHPPRPGCPIPDTHFLSKRASPRKQDKQNAHGRPPGCPRTRPRGCGDG